MRTLERAGPRRAQSPRGDEVDDYHDWLSAQCLTDWRARARALSVFPTSIRRDGSSERRSSSSSAATAAGRCSSSSPSRIRTRRTTRPSRTDRCTTRAIPACRPIIQRHEKLPFAFQMALRKARRSSPRRTRRPCARPRYGRGLIRHVDTLWVRCSSASIWIRRWWASPRTLRLCRPSSYAPEDAVDPLRRPSRVPFVIAAGVAGAGASRASCRAATSRDVPRLRRRQGATGHRLRHEKLAAAPVRRGRGRGHRSLGVHGDDDGVADGAAGPVQARHERRREIEGPLRLEADPGERVNLRRILLPGSGARLLREELSGPRPLAAAARLTLAPYGGVRSVLPRLRRCW